MNALAPHGAGDGLAALLAPVSTPEFFERFFERDVLHVARSNARYFRDLYGVPCVEDALVVGAHEPDRFALIKNGAPPLAPPSFTCERRTVRRRSTRGAPRVVLDPRGVLTAFADGYTLAIHDAAGFHPGLARRCSRIQAEFGLFARANAYFTPPGAQGFPVHYDTHATLIAQIEGDKEWDIYSPLVALPLETQPFTAADATRLGPARGVRLAAGDTLYLPHGVPHAARTAHARSLHLTFTLAPVRAIDLLETAVQIAGQEDVALRRALPPGWQHDPAFAARTSALLRELVSRALGPERITRAAETAYNDLFAAAGTPTGGVFDALAAFETLAPETVVRLRDDTPFALRDRGARLEIVLAAKIVHVPAQARAAIARLVAGPLTFRELTALLPEPAGRLLTRTLVLESLVHIDPF